MREKKTHCKRGHEFSKENTYSGFRKDGSPHRQCRACAVESRRRWYASNADHRNKVSEAHKKAHLRKKGEDPKYQRKQQLLAKYNLTLDQYEEMRAFQNGLCAICGETPRANASLAVDHDHTTGKIRGLLCNLCNAGIGYLKDSPDVLRRAMAYIESHAQSAWQSIRETA